MPHPAQPRLTRPITLQWLLLSSYVGLVVPALAFLVIWAGFNLERAAMERDAHDLDARAASLAPLLREPLEHSSFRRQLSPEVLQLVRAYAQSTGATVTVVDGNLRAFASSDDRVPFATQLSGAEFTSDGEERRWDPIFGEERIFAASPILEDARSVWGFVQVSRSTASLRADVQATWLTLIGAAALVLAGSALGALAVARQIARPVRALTVATRAVAAGDLALYVQPSGPLETRVLADSFNRMSTQVRETLAQQEAFVANAAHELRSPLASIQLRLEMIETHGQQHPDMVAEYMRKLRGEVGSLQHLTEELLTLSVVADPERSPRERMDLAPLLYEIADQYGPLAQDAALQFTVQVPPHLGPVLANASQITMAIRNLLHNALKFTPAEGSVTLTAAEQGGRVEVRVADTGRGIAPESLPHIFDRFFREDRSDHRGAGLGLALVKAVAEGHRGRVEVESVPAHGSTFTISLPVAG